MITYNQLIDNDTLRKYRVTYECVEDSPGWGQAGNTTIIAGFDTYDLKTFSDRAPGNWEIRNIEQYEVPNR